MSSKGQGKRLNESQRSEIIAKLSKPNPPSKRSLAREYGISEGAIRKTWENREAIQKRCASMSEETRTQTFRTSVGRFSELEEILCLWIDSMRHANLPVPPSLAIVKAKQIAAELSISKDAFKASWQWLSRFRQRKSLQKVLLPIEGATVDKEDPVLLAAVKTLHAIIKPYDPENVYSMDETGLFFRLLPRDNLMSSEDIGTTRERRKAKERVSLVVCANATGTHKVPCALIGKPKSPACIRNREWPLKYISQDKAWMDVDTCWKWFNEVFYPEVKKRTEHRVLLLMDNAPGHFEAFERDNVRVLHLSPNCANWKQPCDLGIIAELKERYKYLYLQDVLDFHELDEKAKVRKKAQARRLHRQAAGVSYGNPAHLLDAAKYVKRAWDSMSDTSIKSAFKKAELTTMEEVLYEDVDLMADILHRMKSLGISIDRDELEEFVHCDDENNEAYSRAVLEDVDEFLIMRIKNTPDENDESDNAAVENEVNFNGFDKLYNTVLTIEDQLRCAEVEAEAGDAYDDLRNSFEDFQKKLTQVTLSSQRKRSKTTA